MNISSSNSLITKLQCNLYRFVGTLLLFVSLINLFVSIRYFIYRYRNKNKRLIVNRLSSIIIGMLISSILVIFTGIPLVVIQCFACRPYLSYEMICKIHGFICFCTGLFNM
jgi:succinate dehydrogenase/fumarate reductase cytochrome b subunit